MTEEQDKVDLTFKYIAARMREINAGDKGIQAGVGCESCGWRGFIYYTPADGPCEQRQCSNCKPP